VDASIQAVMFPTFSEFQHDREKLKQMFRRSITFSSFVIFPLMTMLAVVAEPTVRFILGEKWLPCVIFMQIYCFLYSLWHIHTNNLAIMKALGRSDLFLKLEVIKGCVNVLLIVVALVAFKSVYALVGAIAFSSLLGIFINAFPNKKLVDYGYFEQIKDVSPYFIISVLIGIVGFSIASIPINDVALIAIQGLLGSALYLFIAKIAKMDSFEYAWQMLKKARNSRVVPREH
jgi:O-antigen/teichoic acid export membrane protein